MHQQMAQAIYVQTMLAMQAGATDAVASLCNGTQIPIDLTPHASTDGSKESHREEPKSSYKCTECSKCFKDPDVFKLHQRIHNKTENCEKENVNSNTETTQETLKSNPILANLLKTQGNVNLDVNTSILGIENQIMAALAANMESYIRNLMLFQKREDSGGNQDSCDNQDSCVNQDSCDNQDSCGNQDSLDNQDSCENQESDSSKDLDESDNLVIDESAQRDF